jgi:L-threonate 2-dehydrogenase
MLLGAARGGVADALSRELAASEPELYKSLGRRIPDMLPKAYRWVAEMEEISRFLQEDDAAADLYEAAARFYERMAGDVEQLGAESAALRAYFPK